MAVRRFMAKVMKNDHFFGTLPKHGMKKTWSNSTPCKGKGNGGTYWLAEEKNTGERKRGKYLEKGNIWSVEQKRNREGTKGGKYLQKTVGGEKTANMGRFSHPGLLARVICKTRKSDF